MPPGGRSWKSVRSTNCCFSPDSLVIMRSSSALFHFPNERSVITYFPSPWRVIRLSVIGRENLRAVGGGAAISGCIGDSSASPRHKGKGFNYEATARGE